MSTAWPFPFVPQDWEHTPTAVQAYVHTLHNELTQLRERVEAMYDWKMYVEAGDLMAYGPSLPDLHRRAAAYVDKILQGTTPRDLPVERPTKFDLLINLKTALALGLSIPPSILFQADEVIR